VVGGKVGKGEFQVAKRLKKEKGKEPGDEEGQRGDAGKEAAGCHGHENPNGASPGGYECKQTVQDPKINHVLRAVAIYFLPETRE